jgi:hypothetical protein
MQAALRVAARFACVAPSRASPRLTPSCDLGATRRPARRHRPGPLLRYSDPELAVRVRRRECGERIGRPVRARVCPGCAGVAFRRLGPKRSRCCQPPPLRRQATRPQETAPRSPPSRFCNRPDSDSPRLCLVSKQTTGRSGCCLPTSASAATRSAGARRSLALQRPARG